MCATTQVEAEVARPTRGGCLFGTNLLLTHVFLRKGDNQLLNSSINQLLFGQ